MNALIRSADDQISPYQAVVDVSLIRDVDVPAVQPPPANREEKIEKRTHMLSFHMELKDKGHDI